MSPEYLEFRISRNPAAGRSLCPLIASIVIAFAIALTGIQGAKADEDKFTFQIDSISIEPATTIELGKMAVIRCHWSAKFVGEKKLYEVKTQSGTGRIHVEYQDLKKGYPNSIKVISGLAKPGYYTKESPMKGEFKANFDPEIASPAVVVCLAQGPGQTQYQEFAQKLLPIWIKAAALKLESPETQNSAAAPFSAPPPSLSVLAATGMPSGGCGSNPGHFITAKLSIKNMGKTLPPNRGIVRVRGESGLYPINLSSGDFNLPEIKAGEVRAVDVAVAFVNFDKQNVAKLAGTTRLFLVEIAPKQAGAFPEVKGFSFPVSFPPGLCAANLTAPSSRTAAPAGIPPAPGAPGSREPARPGARQP